MEQKMKCPYCGRCIGFVQSTDDENSVFSITKSEPKIVGKKQRTFHCTCQVLFGYVQCCPLTVLSSSFYFQSR